GWGSASFRRWPRCTVARSASKTYPGESWRSSRCQAREPPTTGAPALIPWPRPLQPNNHPTKAQTRRPQDAASDQLSNYLTNKPTRRAQHAAPCTAAERPARLGAQAEVGGEEPEFPP